LERIHGVPQRIELVLYAWVGRTSKRTVVFKVVKLQR
jgi:hypothetical protein